MNANLTMEQTYLLHKIAIEARDSSREELVEALLNCWEDRFRQKQVFLAASKEAGFAFKFNEGAAFFPSDEDENEVVAVHLSEEDESLKEMIDSANFELDMDAIVLGRDE